MKVTLVADRLTYNGRSTYALHLARGLKESGVDLRFCLPGGELRPQLDDLNIENYIIKYNFFSFRRLVSFLAEFQPDILHITSEHALAVGRRIARHLRRSFVVSVHDLLEVSGLSVGGAQAVVVTNEALREVLVNRFEVPKSKIRLIPRGVDLSLFDLAPVSLNDRLPVVGCVGRLVPGKGQDHFIKAARRVLDNGFEALFLLVGEGKEEGKLRRLIRELDLTEFVTISPPIPDPRKVYRAIDIVVVPTVQAAGSTTALEAMAARRPVVASCVGDLIHLVRNEENGLTVEPGNSESLARAIIRLLADPDFAKRLGEKARQFVSARYPLTRMIEGTLALYQDLLEHTFPR